MAVIQEFQEFHLNQYNDTRDLSRPLGEWEGLGVAIGDVSGGNIVLTLDLGGKFLFSYEAWTMFGTFGITGSFQTTWTPNIIPGGQAYIAGAVGVPFVTVHGIQMNETHLKFPVSGRAVKGGTPPQLTISAAANLDLMIYRGNAWGYYWDKRAPQLSSGLIRP